MSTKEEFDAAVAEVKAVREHREAQQRQIELDAKITEALQGKSIIRLDLTMSGLEDVYTFIMSDGTKVEFLGRDIEVTIE